MKKIITLLLCLSCLVSEAQYTDPSQNVNILSNQSFKKVIPFTIFNSVSPNALSVFYKGGINEQNITFEWYLYHIDTVITHSGLLGLFADTTYPFQQISAGQETISDGEMNTFLSNKNARFYIIATKKGFVIQ